MTATRRPLYVVTWYCDAGASACWLLRASRTPDRWRVEASGYDARPTALLPTFAFLADRGEARPLLPIAEAMGHMRKRRMEARSFLVPSNIDRWPADLRLPGTGHDIGVGCRHGSAEIEWGAIAAEIRAARTSRRRRVTVAVAGWNDVLDQKRAAVRAFRDTPDDLGRPAP